MPKAFAKVDAGEVSQVQRLAWRHVHRSPRSKLNKWTSYYIIVSCCSMSCFLKTCVINSCASCFFATATNLKWCGESCFTLRKLVCMRYAFELPESISTGHNIVRLFQWLVSAVELTSVYLCDSVWHLSIDWCFRFYAWLLLQRIYFSPCSFW